MCLPLVVLLASGGATVAQLERPRWYCLNELDDGTCIDGDEYTVTRVEPDRGFAGVSGQSVAIIGELFPPSDTTPITCEFTGPNGALPSSTARFISSSEIQCNVPETSERGLFQITLAFEAQDIPGFSSNVLRYEYREPDRSLLDLNATTLFDIFVYLAWAMLALCSVFSVVFCIFWRRRVAKAQQTKLLRVSGAEREERMASAWAAGSGYGGLTDSLLGEPFPTKRQGALLGLPQQGSDASSRQEHGRRGSVGATSDLLSTQGSGKEPCYKRPCCCLAMGVLNGFWAAATVGILLFMNYVDLATDLSGGNPDFDTLTLADSNPTSVSVNWKFHVPGAEPDTLLYELALAEVSTGLRRRLVCWDCIRASAAIFALKHVMHS